MFSSLFIKLFLVSLGTSGIGVGAYLIYKNVSSREVEKTEKAAGQTDTTETINESSGSPVSRPDPQGNPSTST